MKLTPKMSAALEYVPPEWANCAWPETVSWARSITALRSNHLIEFRRVRGRYQYRRTKSGDDALR